MVLALAFAGKFSCRKKAENPHPLPEEEKQKIKKQFVETSSLPASITMMFISFAYSAVMSFLAKYSIALGLGSMSIFFVYYAFSLLITRVIAGKYTDKHGMYNILPMGILVMMAVFVILGFSRNILLFLIAAVLYGLGYGSVQPTLNAIVMSVCAPHRRGAANTIFFGAMDIGIGLGATIWGIIADKTGYSFMYFFCIVVMAISLIYCFVVFRGKFGRNSLPNMDMQG
jgi:MFS family permease